ncbi:MAG: hypothetical protein ABR497_12660 [Kiritimatiellia bacterium]
MAKTTMLNIGDRRELFVDDLLVEKMRRTAFKLHQPVPRELALVHDHPCEGPATIYHTVIQDGNRVLLYYRGKNRKLDTEVYCVAESKDGINFTRPALDICPLPGMKRNNVILMDPGPSHNFAPFLDLNPRVKPSERFKALGRASRLDRQQKHALLAFSSPDGLHWKPLQKTPVIVNDTEMLAFDSQNVSFWSESENCYVTYYRTWSSRCAMAPTSRNAAKRIRRISRATSPDYRHWTGSTEMSYRTCGRPSPMEEFYTNQTLPYFHAPHIYVAMPARFMKARRAISDEEAQAIQVHPGQRNDCSDACFMTSRPGRDYYDRTRMEAWLRPGIGPEYWSARNNYPAHGVIQTGSAEMSVYIDDHYQQPGNRLRRYVLRLDGFMSINAPYAGGEALTRPFVFTGGELELNYQTSAAGELRVELQTAAGRPIPGYTLKEADALFGNFIAGRATWRGGAKSVAQLAGRNVRLRFVMRDADLYSLRFIKA